MAGLLETLPAGQRQLAGRARPGPELAARPMLATLSDRRDFSDPGEEWVFERKLDGIRVLAVREGGRVTLLSRSGRRLNDTYPEIVDALAAQSCGDFVLDGEIVAFTGGRTDFARLQQRMGLTRRQDVAASSVAVTYYVFDLLRLDGADTRRLPLRARKSLLRRALAYRSPLRLTPHRNTGGAELLADVCARGWEGLIAKRADGVYEPRRSADWLKLKCSQGQEFVVGGFTEPAGSRVGLGALLLGYYEGERLRYAGKVGTGFDRRTLLDLRERLEGARERASPFDGPVREAGARWVRPELVAQIAFTEWTRDGMLRHPRYLGLRDDKKPRDVVRERPAGRASA
ncbi:DNA polymerase LigD, ligase domain-containing protein [Streptomyces viridochromogenes DSM 40736]|uniref:DNA ligase (ATP) n=1 Tax=Streptomyces viridochromogenes (strain DSM 40736 / JCM 4977 / BCRC 1201 / Tue 494) TaxID=591159 RepID=D9X5Z6_STRVT|nr:non-homologous end-joining DNA ligase [Streptomyces viridochromogenes]EFL29749.1 DNA polymerase LigD, ligase domain-containing protein [Streptomyces viridochromogenes DSM 40736]